MCMYLRRLPLFPFLIVSKLWNKEKLCQLCLTLHDNEIGYSLLNPPVLPFCPPHVRLEVCVIKLDRFVAVTYGIVVLSELKLYEDSANFNYFNIVITAKFLNRTLPLTAARLLYNLELVKTLSGSISSASEYNL